MEFIARTRTPDPSRRARGRVARRVHLADCGPDGGSGRAGCHTLRRRSTENDCRKPRSLSCLAQEAIPLHSSIRFPGRHCTLGRATLRRRKLEFEVAFRFAEYPENGRPRTLSRAWQTESMRSREVETGHFMLDFATHVLRSSASLLLANLEVNSGSERRTISEVVAAARFGRSLAQSLGCCGYTI